MEKINNKTANANDFGKSLKKYNNSNNDNIQPQPTIKEGEQSTNHIEILEKLLTEVKKIDFRKIADLEPDTKLQQKHFIIICIDELLKISTKNDWGLCKKNNIIYLYNGAYWKTIDKDTFQSFLKNVALKMGINEYDAKHFEYKDKLFKQFISDADLSIKEPETNEVLINLQNGTFVITPETQNLREPKREDFIKYQLSFRYDPEAKTPLFEKYLNRVQPDIERQKILAEYLGYIFINNLKLEKALILYGSGANGKSVFFDIINALLGGENVCSYSLQNLTKYDSYQRAELENKLVNYTSEINGKLETSIFKQLVSGEPVEARQIYGNPFIMKNYAKLIFNCNELPKEVEQTNAYFRRFLIVPFDITLPEKEWDKELANKIIKDELSGVFNWVLNGLKRLLEQKSFTESEAVNKQLDHYKKTSDSVLMFIDEENYVTSIINTIKLSDLYSYYRNYCIECGNKPCSNNTFSERLRNNGFDIEKKNYGRIVHIEKQTNFN